MNDYNSCEDYEENRVINIYRDLSSLELYNLLFINVPPKMIIDIEKFNKIKKDEIKAITRHRIEVCNFINNYSHLYQDLHYHLNQYLSGYDYSEKIKAGLKLINEKVIEKVKHNNIYKNKINIFNCWHPKTLYNWYFKLELPLLSKNLKYLSKKQIMEIKYIISYEYAIWFWDKKKDLTLLELRKKIRFINHSLKDYFRGSISNEAIKKGREEFEYLKKNYVNSNADKIKKLSDLEKLILN